MRTSRLPFALALLAFAAAPVLAQESGTLKKIKDTGTITIGHRDASIPFSYSTTSSSRSATRWTSACRIVDAVKTELKMPNLKVNLQSGHLGQPHPADGERHDRPRVRLDDEQPRAPEAGRLHHHVLRDRQPLGREEVVEAEDARRPEGQDDRLDGGHDQHQADQRDQRREEPGHEHHLGQRPPGSVPDGRDRPRRGVRDGRHPARRPGRQLAQSGRVRHLVERASARAVRHHAAQGRPRSSRRSSTTR